MNVTLSTKELSTTLKVLAMAIGKRNTLPILDNVLIETLPPDLVRLTICNLEFADFYLRRALHVTTPINEAEAITVNLAKLRNSLPAPKSSLVVSLENHGDAQPFILRYGASNIRLDVLPAAEFPPFQLDPEPSTATIFDKNLSTFRTALAATFPATSTDQARPILTAIHGHGTCLESADGFRLHRQEIGQSIPELLLGGKLAKALLMSTAESGWIDSKDSRLYYSDSEGWISSSDTINYYGRSYPDLEQVIPRANQYLVMIERKDVQTWQNALSAAYKASEMRVVKLAIGDKNKNQVDLSTPNGAFSAAVPAEVITSGEFAIGFNAGYMRDALSSAGDAEKIRIELTVETTPAKITTDQGYTAVVMPMHLDNC